MCYLVMYLIGAHVRCSSTTGKEVLTTTTISDHEEDCNIVPTLPLLFALLALRLSYRHAAHPRSITTNFAVAPAMNGSMWD